MKKTKTTVLTFVAKYLPGYKSGGPVRTIANMVDQLGDKLDFRIVTSDRDSFDSKAYATVVIDDWNTVGKAKVFYISPKSLSLMNLTRLIRETPHDVMYLNSFFNPYFSLRPLLLRRLGLIPERPAVIAPRGEFSTGALEIKSWKKRPYMFFSKVLGIYRNLTWQASSEHEFLDILKVMGSKAERVVIAKDLTAASDSMLPEEMQNKRNPDESLRVCFLSRIAPMKNLDYALRVLSKIKTPLEFHIYGVIHDEAYWQNCQEQVTQLPKNVAISYHGLIDHADVAKTMAEYDLFFLPTRGENFGHVIFEALASGVPVLISDQTPWRNLEALGIGWDLPLCEIEKFKAVIEEQAMLNNEARMLQKLRAKQYAKLISMDEKVLDDNLSMFTRLTVGNQ